MNSEEKVYKSVLLQEINAIIREKEIVPNRDEIKKYHSYLCVGLKINKIIDNEKYKNWVTNIEETELSLILETIASNNDEHNEYASNFIQSTVSEEGKRRHGVVFTPRYIADYITNKAIIYWKEENKKKTIEQIADISCGMGVFLESAFYATNGKVNLLGIDQNNMFITLSKINKLNQNMNIKCADALFECDEDIQKSDIIIGNPPYVRYQNIPNEYSMNLKQKYGEYLVGNYDLSMPFIIRSMECLKEGGVCALLLTSKFMSSNYGKWICEKIANEYRILEIIDFKDAQIFPEKTTYTCVLILTKSKNKYKELLITGFPCNLKWKKEDRQFEYAYSYKIPYENIKVSPWKLQQESEQKILKKISETNVDLKSMFNISQGFRTGLNSVFVIDNKKKSDFEACGLRPYIKGENIKAGVINKSKFVIWPYEKVSEDVNLISESEFQKKMPKIYNYLKDNYEVLCENSSNKRFWYSYKRPQNMLSQYKAKIIVKEMMPVAEFAVDLNGEYCIGSGYALTSVYEMTSEEISLWAYILNTPLMEYQLRNCGTVLNSGWFRMYKKHLESVKLFELTQNEIKRMSDEITKTNLANARKMLNDFVAKKYGISETEKEYVMLKLLEYHKRSREAQTEIDMEYINAKKNVNIYNKMIEKSSYEDNLRCTDYPELSAEDRKNYYPVELTQYNKCHVYDDSFRTLVTFSKNKKYPIHSWYNYTQGYSEDVVIKLLRELDAKENDVVFDPFCGSGTTILTANMRGMKAYGTDISPLMVWITNVKNEKWDVGFLCKVLNDIKDTKMGYASTDKLMFEDYMKKAYSHDILSQIIFIRDWINQQEYEDKYKKFLMLGLLGILEEVSNIRKHGSHYRFLNKVNVGTNKLNIEVINEDAQIKSIYLYRIEKMITDVKTTSYSHNGGAFCIDSKSCYPNIEKADIIITSPPYLNRNNYFAQQKAELSVLQLVRNMEEYKTLVKSSMCSHIDGTMPKEPISIIPEVNIILESVLKHKSNNAKIPNMIAGYFDDLYYSLNNLKDNTNKQCKLAFVVGNSRWNGVVIPVDHLLCLIAESLGYKVEKIIVARMKGNSPQQMAKYGRIPVRESIVILKR